MYNILLLLITLTLPDIKHYKDKIYYIQPEKSEKIEGNFYIIFKTGIKSEKAFLLQNGYLLTYKNGEINEYTPSGKLLYSNKLHFDAGIIVPSDFGKFVIIGKPDRKNKTYDILKLDMESGNIEKIITLDKKHFPGTYAPIERAKKIMEEDPSFRDDYFGLVYQQGNFSGGKIVNNNLYLWFLPEIGLYFGGIYKISLKTGKLSVIADNVGKVCGITRKGISYIILKDKDATEMEKAIHIKGINKERKFPFPYLTFNTVFANGTGATINQKTLYVFRTPSISPLHKIIINGEDVQLLNISPSGNRIFVKYRNKNKNILSLLDIREGKLEQIMETSRGDFANLHCTYDAEAFIFTLNDTLYTGYLNDLYAPFISISLPDTVFNDTVKVKVKAEDVAFVSSGTKLFFNNNKIKPDTVLTLILEEGDNFFVFKATDRANNLRNLRKHVFYIPEDQ